jgi:hypothetical protein
VSPNVLDRSLLQRIQGAVSLLSYSTTGAGWHMCSALVDEPMANRTFADLDLLADILVTRCQTLRANRRTVNVHIRFHWWPRERHPRTHR